MQCGLCRAACCSNLLVDLRAFCSSFIVQISHWLYNSLPHLNPDWFCLSTYTGLPRLLEKRPLNGCGSAFDATCWPPHQITTLSVDDVDEFRDNLKSRY